MNDYEQYFTILNLSNSASLQDIKKAYRLLSIKYHPDKNNQANPELFNKVNEAYVKLTTNFSTIQICLQNMKFQQSMTLQNNSSHRLVNSHDLVNGRDLINNHGFANGYGLTNNNNNNNNIINNNINNYQDIIITLNINYCDAYNGASKPVTIERKLVINNVISHEMETLYIVITKGIDTNEMIILQNKGNIYINNATTNYSNIKIIIVLTKHEYFERNGLDLCFLKTITLKEALSGFAFSLAHINNKHYNIVSNEIIDFKYEKIIPNLGFIRDSYVGNLIIKFNIIFPKIISQENKVLLQTLL